MAANHNSPQPSEKDNSSFLDEILEMVFSLIWGIVRTAPVALAWVVVVIVTAHPWRAPAAWGVAALTWGPVVVALGIIAHWLPGVHHVLPWGDIARHRWAVARVDRRRVARPDRRAARTLVRSWPAAALAAGIATVTTDARGREHVTAPRVVGVASDPLGVAITVRAVPGQTLAELVAVAPRLVTAWSGGRDVRAAVGGGADVRYTVVTSDPLGGTREATGPHPVPVPPSSGWMQS